MSKNILFIFEGDRAEKRLFESFEQFYFNEEGESTIVATFGTTVYPLYGQLVDDEFLDVVEILRDRSKDNRERSVEKILPKFICFLIMKVTLAMRMMKK